MFVERRLLYELNCFFALVWLSWLVWPYPAVRLHVCLFKKKRHVCDSVCIKGKPVVVGQTDTAK